MSVSVCVRVCTMYTGAPGVALPYYCKWFDSMWYIGCPQAYPYLIAHANNGLALQYNTPPQAVTLSILGALLVHAACEYT